MDIRQLKYFLTIAEEGNITKAAEKLHMSQPPLSQQLKILETELGVQLIDRNTRNITLTDVGEALLHRSQQIMDLFELTKNELKDIHEGLSGVLSIGTVSAVGATFLPNIINNFHKSYPGVNFEIFDDDSDKIMDMLKHGLIDLGIVRTPFNKDDYGFYELPSVSFTVAGKSCFGLNGLDGIGLKNLTDKPLLIQRRYEADINAAFSDLGYKPRILCKSNDVRTLLSWADSGIGIALIPDDCRLLLPTSDLCYVNLTDYFLKIGTAILWSNKHYQKSITTHFIELLKGSK